MPISAPQWTEFLTCPICSHDFNENPRQPISLGCGHTVCKSCLSNLHRTVCPFDQSTINLEVELLPINYALLQLLGYAVPLAICPEIPRIKENESHYQVAKTCIEELALYLKPIVPRGGSSSENGNSGLTNGTLSRPMHRKLVTLVNCQLAEEEGCARVMRAVRSLGERTVLEFILLHQNSAQLSQNLWIAVRTRGCQFLGPAMQEDALKYILLALEGGEALSRKVLVLFAVQRLENLFPHASKTSIGHVVQLLYRASCFKVTKRDDESSLMQLKESFRTYDALRREHDSQIVQIALEAGLRISPEQWSALLYGDQTHKSHMQSIIDKLQTPESFASSIQELTIALQRSSDPAQLGRLREHFELLSRIDGSPDAKSPTWQDLEDAIKAVNAVVQGLVEFTKIHGMRVKTSTEQPIHSKFKTSMCRDYAQRGSCPRGASCTFAHSDDELDKYRRKAKATRPSGSSMVNARGSGGLSDQQQQQYTCTSSSHCNEDSLENGHGSRNGSMRSTSHCLPGNDRDYAVPSSSYGPLMHRCHNNHNSHDAVVQQLRNLNIHQSQSVYSGPENGYNSARGSLSSDCHTPPHNSEQSFSYPSYYRQSMDGRSSGYSSMNGNGQNLMNGHIDGVGRQVPTRTSPLTVEEASLNGVNGMNGMNGVNGMMNGHSDYAICQTRLDDARLRKSNLINYSGSPRYRCSQFASPNGYSQFHSGSYYPPEVNPGFGPIGTRVYEIDRYGGLVNYQSSAPRGPSRFDGCIEIIHNPSFHPHTHHPHVNLENLTSRKPFDGDSDSDGVPINMQGILPSSPTAPEVFPTDDSSPRAEDCTFMRPHLNSGSSGVGSSSESSHYSPSGSPLQHSPDAWAEKSEKEISTSAWPNVALGREAQVWKPLGDHVFPSLRRAVSKDTVSEDNDESVMWPLSGKKRHNYQALLDIDISPCSGYWSDPEIQRYRQIKDDEDIARQLQDDDTPKIIPSAPLEIYEDNPNDATIALELQNMENDEHDVKVEKERKEFAERKEVELVKMKQEEEDRKMAIRVQNEEDGVTIITDEATIDQQARLYKEKVERMKLNRKESQELKDRELAEALVYEDAFNHGYLPRPDPELTKPVTYPVKIIPRPDPELTKPGTYPVKIIPRGSRVTPLSTTPSSTGFDIAESAIP